MTPRFGFALWSREDAAFAASALSGTQGRGEERGGAGPRQRG